MYCHTPRGRRAAHDMRVRPCVRCRHAADARIHAARRQRHPAATVPQPRPSCPACPPAGRGGAALPPARPPGGDLLGQAPRPLSLPRPPRPVSRPPRCYTNMSAQRQKGFIWDLTTALLHQYVCTTPKGLHLGSHHRAATPICLSNAKRASFGISPLRCYTNMSAQRQKGFIWDLTTALLHQYVCPTPKGLHLGSHHCAATPICLSNAKRASFGISPPRCHTNMSAQRQKGFIWDLTTALLHQYVCTTPKGLHLGSHHCAATPICLSNAKRGSFGISPLRCYTNMSVQRQGFIWDLTTALLHQYVCTTPKGLHLGSHHRAATPICLHNAKRASFGISPPRCYTNMSVQPKRASFGMSPPRCYTNMSAQRQKGFIWDLTTALLHQYVCTTPKGLHLGSHHRAATPICLSNAKRASFGISPPRCHTNMSAQRQKGFIWDLTTALLHQYVCTTPKGVHLGSHHRATPICLHTNMCTTPKGVHLGSHHRAATPICLHNAKRASFGISPPRCYTNMSAQRQKGFIWDLTTALLHQYVCPTPKGLHLGSHHRAATPICLHNAKRASFGISPPRCYTNMSVQRQKGFIWDLTTSLLHQYVCTTPKGLHLGSHNCAVTPICLHNAKRASFGISPPRCYTNMSAQRQKGFIWDLTTALLHQCLHNAKRGSFGISPPRCYTNMSAQRQKGFIWDLTTNAAVTPICLHNAKRASFGISPGAVTPICLSNAKRASFGISPPRCYTNMSVQRQKGFIWDLTTALLHQYVCTTPKGLHLGSHHCAATPICLHNAKRASFGISPPRCYTNMSVQRQKGFIWDLTTSLLHQYVCTTPKGLHLGSHHRAATPICLHNAKRALFGISPPRCYTSMSAQRQKGFIWDLTTSLLHQYVCTTPKGLHLGSHHRAATQYVCTTPKGLHLGSRCYTNMSAQRQKGFIWDLTTALLHQYVCTTPKGLHLGSHHRAATPVCLHNAKRGSFGISPLRCYTNMSAQRQKGFIWDLTTALLHQYVCTTPKGLHLGSHHRAATPVCLHNAKRASFGISPPRCYTNMSAQRQKGFIWDLTTALLHQYVCTTPKGLYLGSHHRAATPVCLHNAKRASFGISPPRCYTNMSAQRQKGFIWDLTTALLHQYVCTTPKGLHLGSHHRAATPICLYNAKRASFGISPPRCYTNMSAQRQKGFIWDLTTALLHQYVCTTPKGLHLGSHHCAVTPICLHNAKRGSFGISPPRCYPICLHNAKRASFGISPLRCYTNMSAQRQKGFIWDLTTALLHQYVCPTPKGVHLGSHHCAATPICLSNAKRGSFGISPPRCYTNMSAQRQKGFIWDLTTALLHQYVCTTPKGLHLGSHHCAATPICLSNAKRGSFGISPPRCYTSMSVQRQKGFIWDLTTALLHQYVCPTPKGVHLGSHHRAATPVCLSNAKRASFGISPLRCYTNMSVQRQKGFIWDLTTALLHQYVCQRQKGFIWDLTTGCLCLSTPKGVHLGSHHRAATPICLSQRQKGFIWDLTTALLHQYVCTTPKGLHLGSHHRAVTPICLHNAKRASFGISPPRCYTSVCPTPKGLHLGSHHCAATPICLSNAKRGSFGISPPRCYTSMSVQRQKGFIWDLTTALLHQYVCPTPKGVHLGSHHRAATPVCLSNAKRASFGISPLRCYTNMSVQRQKGFIWDLTTALLHQYVCPTPKGLHLGSHHCAATPICLSNAKRASFGISPPRCYTNMSAQRQKGFIWDLTTALLHQYVCPTPKGLHLGSHHRAATPVCLSNAKRASFGISPPRCYTNMSAQRQKGFIWDLTTALLHQYVCPTPKGLHLGSHHRAATPVCLHNAKRASFGISPPRCYTNMSAQRQKGFIWDLTTALLHQYVCPTPKGLHLGSHHRAATPICLHNAKRASFGISPPRCYTSMSVQRQKGFIWDLTTALLHQYVCTTPKGLHLGSHHRAATPICLHNAKRGSFDTQQNNWFKHHGGTFLG